MSIQAMAWVLEHSESTQSDRLVLMAIANHADAEGRNAWPKQELIASEAKVSVRTVKRAVASLAEMGELAVVSHGGAVVGRGRTNYYVIPGVGQGAKMAPSEGGQIGPPGNEQGDICDNKGTSATDKGPTVAPQEPSEPSIEPSVLRVGEEQVDVVESLCGYLADRIEMNGSKRPTVTKRWRDAARLMVDADGRTPAQIIRAIDWCQSDEFWRANILSMPKLRQQYDTLRLQAQRKVGRRNGDLPNAVQEYAEAVR